MYWSWLKICFPEDYSNFAALSVKLINNYFSDKFLGEQKAYPQLFEQTEQQEKNNCYVNKTYPQKKITRPSEWYMF